MLRFWCRVVFDGRQSIALGGPTSKKETFFGCPSKAAPSSLGLDELRFMLRLYDQKPCKPGFHLNMPQPGVK